MKNMYGNITRPNTTESSNLWSIENPLAVPKTSTGIIISAIAMRISKITISKESASDAKSSGLFLELIFFQQKGDEICLVM